MRSTERLQLLKNVLRVRSTSITTTHPSTHTHTHIHFSILTPLPISSVHFSRSVVSDSLQPHGLQHARPPWPSPTPGVHPISCPLSQWCHPTISSSVVPFSSRLQSYIRVFSNESALRIRWPKYWTFSFNISTITGYILLVFFLLAYLGGNLHHFKSCRVGPTGQGLKWPCLINIWKQNPLCVLELKCQLVLVLQMHLWFYLYFWCRWDTMTFFFFWRFLM